MSSPLRDDFHRVLFQKHPQPMWVADARSLRLLAVNSAAVRHYGYSESEFLKLRFPDLAKDPQNLDSTGGDMTAEAVAATARHFKKDGSPITVEISTVPLTYRGLDTTLIVIHDISERIRTAEALADANERLNTFIQAVPLAIIAQDAEGRIRLWNSAAEAVFGWSAAEALGNRLPLIPSDHPDPLPDLSSHDQSATLTEVVRNHKDGRSILINTCSIALVGANGTPEGSVSFSIDLSERKQLEAALRQTAKMEAVGRLAGGVAHDFNNLLTIILGYCNLGLAQLQPVDPLYPNLEGIRKAADRGARLTRQMLTFSRKQVLKPKLLDLNAIVSETSRMLRRLIGEHVQLLTAQDPALHRIEGDAGQLEQILMNLTVNARDAMPEGGTIVIETSNIFLDEIYARRRLSSGGGNFVLLSVSDTGVGMDAETQSHIFEPFFTTKPAEQGTGLGLSTVYGIVKQSGGHIWVYSEPSHGTAFKIYFPAHPSGPEAAEKPSAPALRRRGTETILLVEDETELRQLAREILETCGYQVLEAADGQDALVVAAGYPGHIHLMVSDVVMPRLGGRPLATRLAEVRPTTRVIFMSGYTADSVVHHGVLDSGIAYLEKPFTAESLTQKVREVLDL